MDFPAIKKIEEVASQIIEAAKTLESSACPEKRHLAYEFFEKTKDDANLGIPCGFFLSGCDKDPQIRHLGLTLLEDTVRYHWNEIASEKKVYIKENCMLLLASGTLDILVEPMYMKDKISRIIVEMMKREWPQQWPSLMEDLEKLANVGPTQVELVLLIFMRISEDVATLQNLDSTQRRKDLYQTLNQNMDSIFCFFFKLLEEHYTKYRDNSSKEDKLKHCRITQVVFSTIACYAEWVSIQCIHKHQRNLFTAMCQLISDENIRQNAVECLLQIVSRKGKPEERKFMLLLFTNDVMGALFHAAELASANQTNEDNYLFLKRLSQVITALGSQLCCLWGKEPGVEEPECFSVYLNALLAFTKHPSLTIYSYSNLLWAQFFRHDVIAKNNTLATFIPLYIEIAYSKILKHGFPSQDNSVSCEFSRLDFDCDEDYNLFFCSVRSATCEVIKFLSFLNPKLMFGFLMERFVRNVQSNGTGNLQNEWDALSHIVERVMSQVVLRKRDFQLPKDRVKTALQWCFEYKTTDADIMSSLLTCISGLCCALPLISDEYEPVLNKLFECLLYTGGQPKESRSKAIKNTRKHAASLILKLCKTYPNIFLSAFAFMKPKIAELTETEELTQLERVTTVQALIILNNLIACYEFQSLNIGQFLQSTKADWLPLKDVFSSPVSLMSYIGLDSSTQDPQEIETFGLNRAKIFSCCDFVLAVLNRCKPATLDAKALEEGGLLLSRTEDGVIFRNPATPHVLELLPNIFLFLRSYNALHLPESLARVAEIYARAFNIPEDEKIALLGTRNTAEVKTEKDVTKTTFQRMQNFLRTIHEHLCLILAACGPNMSTEFYSWPHLSDCLIHSVFWNLPLLPNFKIRFTIRVLKPLIENCPKEYFETVILPLIYYISPIMMNELQSRWDRVSQVRNDEDYDDDNVDTEELVNSMSLHSMSREYLEAITIILTERPSSTSTSRENSSATEAVNGDACEDMETNESGDHKQSQNLSVRSISHLGKLALRCDAICQALVLTLLRALNWPDSVSCRKAITPLYMSIQEMVEGEGHQHLNEEAVRQIFLGVLGAIHLHGQHYHDLDSLADLGVSLYEKLRPHFSVLRDVLLSLPDGNERNVTEFEAFLAKLESSAKKSNKQNKFKRDAFKKVVHSIIGKSLGETLKREVHFTNLKPIFWQRKHKQPVFDDANEELNLCSLFATSGH